MRNPDRTVVLALGLGHQPAAVGAWLGQTFGVRAQKSEPLASVAPPLRAPFSTGVFETYAVAHAWAQAIADHTHLSLGIEAPTEYREGYLVRYIPRKEHRYGCDYLCEAVEPS